MLKKLLIIITLLFCFIGLSTHNVEAASDKTDVAVNKVFTIKFSSELDESTINIQNIFITDAFSDKLISNIDIKLLDNKKEVTIGNKLNYVQGATYYLTITKDVTSAKGVKLKNDVKMKFTITNDILEISDITPAINKYMEELQKQAKDKDIEIATLNDKIATLEEKIKELEENTIVPTTPTNGELGKSRANAAKINQTVTVENDDWLDGLQKFELTLTEVVDGQEAWNMIYAANKFNFKPDPGMKYVLAKFKVNVLDLEKEPMDINHAMFDVVSKNGVMYNDYVNVVTPKPNLSTNLYSESIYEGWTYFMVDENDSPKVVYNEGRDSETWFDLGL